MSDNLAPGAFRDTCANIAIVGMAAYLPGADGIAAHWNILARGVESICRDSRDDLIAAGEAPHLVDWPYYVPAAAPRDARGAAPPQERVTRRHAISRCPARADGFKLHVTPKE